MYDVVVEGRDWVQRSGKDASGNSMRKVWPGKEAADWLGLIREPERIPQMHGGLNRTPSCKDKRFSFPIRREHTFFCRVSPLLSLEFRLYIQKK